MDYILDVPLEILEDIDVNVIISNNEDLGY